MPRLYLAPAVFACANDDGAIFLDVERDLYLGLDAQQAHALASEVTDWPRAVSEQARAEAELFVAQEVATSLLQSGVLRDSEPAQRLLQSAELPRITAPLHSWPEMDPHDVRVRDVIVFLLSWLTAVWLTRRGHLMSAVKRVHARRKHQPLSAERLAEAHLSKARKALGRYIHVRAFFFGKRGRCLLDSLTLLEFLAHEGLYPYWVIAVQVRPFAAHSWVQEGSFVFNGTPGYAGAYSPILVV